MQINSTFLPNSNQLTDELLCPVDQEPLLYAVKLNDNCSHLFNEAVIKEMLARQNPSNCPLCRKTFTAYTPEEKTREIVREKMGLVDPEKTPAENCVNLPNDLWAKIFSEIPSIEEAANSLLNTCQNFRRVGTDVLSQPGVLFEKGFPKFGRCEEMLFTSIKKDGDGFEINMSVKNLRLF